MAVYCFKCTHCGVRLEGLTPQAGELMNKGQPHVFVRDYHAEGVGFNGLAEMKRQRELGLDGLSGRSEQRDLFLPTAEELATPKDPRGQKAIRDWADKHKPAEKNRQPLWPAMEKKVY